MNSRINKGFQMPVWNRLPVKYIITSVLLGLFIYSCNDVQSPLNEPLTADISAFQEASVLGVNESDPVEIQNFTITFNGKEFDQEANTTTFSYTVSRGGDASGFNFMLFEVPSCADLSGYTPLNGSSLTDEGIMWTSSIGANSSRDYSITYAGEVVTGMTDVTIQSSGTNTTSTKAVAGPCKGTYSISGFVYVDENGNSTRNSGEGGIGNVTVSLFDGDDQQLGSAKTLGDGSYSFTVFAGNNDRNFSLSVPTETPGDMTDFNEVLFNTYTSLQGANGTSVVVSGSDVSGVNFGFEPDTQGIIEKFENPDAEGGIALLTEDPEFWRDELFFSTRGRKTVYSQQELLAFLIEIENLDLTFVFDFGTDKITAAIDILATNRKSTELDILLSELLSAKLNVVSGGGAQGGPDFNADEFNLLILKTGAAAALAGSDNNTIQLSTQNLSISSPLEASSTSSDSGTLTLLSSFNRSGTGGGGIGTN
ncbi:MAG: SdrD B-like domain-containing protein [Cyclonatronaceae bacterium]